MEELHDMILLVRRGQSLKWHRSVQAHWSDSHVGIKCGDLGEDKIKDILDHFQAMTSAI